MRIFGGVLPFIGFRKCYVDRDGWPMDRDSGLIADTFEAEWLGIGMVFVTFNLRRGNL